MRDSKEVTERVLARRDEYESRMKERRITVKKGIIAICTVALIAACALGIAVMNKQEAPVTPDPAVTETGTTETGSGTGETEGVTNPPIGGTTVCAVHANSRYHDFPDTLIQYVGMDEFRKWVESHSNNTEHQIGECAFPDETIYTFIKDFNIPKDEFLKRLTYREKAFYNADLLYSDDIEAIDAYFRDIEVAEITSYKCRNYERLLELILNENAAKMDELGLSRDFCNVPELAVNLGISKEMLESYIRTVAENATDGKYFFDYNLGMIYNDKSIAEKPESPESGENKAFRAYELGSRFCGLIK